MLSMMMIYGVHALTHQAMHTPLQSAVMTVELIYRAEVEASHYQDDRLGQTRDPPMIHPRD